MNRSVWIDALGAIDEQILGDFIENDMKLVEKQSVSKENRPRMSWIAPVAACLCMCAVAALAVYVSLRGIIYGPGGPSSSETLDPFGTVESPSESSTLEEETPPASSSSFEIPDDPIVSADGLEFVLTDNGDAYAVSKYSGSAGEVIIPEIFLEKQVVAISDGAFGDNANIVSVSMPDSIRSVGNDAFANCTRLTDLVLPEGLKKLGDRAFLGCMLLSDITLPDGVEEIGIEAFARTGIVEITVPGSVKTVRNYLFDDCDKLTNVIFSEGIEEIGDYVFDGCVLLTSVGFPSSLQRLGYQGTFNGFSNMRYKSYEGGLYLGNSEDRYLIFVRPLTNGTEEITLAAECKFIVENAFSYCTASLTSVILPDGLIGIGVEAFKGCGGLTAIGLPNTLKYIGHGAFEQCSLLSEVLIPEGVEEIGTYTFDGCGLVSLTIPSTVKCIKQRGIPYVSEITFGGTMAEWEALIENSDDKSMLRSIIAHCTNGTVPGEEGQ